MHLRHAAPRRHPTVASNLCHEQVEHPGGGVLYRGATAPRRCVGRRCSPRAVTACAWVGRVSEKVAAAAPQLHTNTGEKAE